MFFVVRSNNSFNFPLGLIKYIVIVSSLTWKMKNWGRFQKKGSFKGAGWSLMAGSNVTQFALCCA